MLNVPIDRIVPLTDARDNFSRIVADIENQKDGLYVLTKGGKPAIALINISYLSELMNGTAVLPQPHSKPAEIEKEKEITNEPVKPKTEDKPATPEVTVVAPKAPEPKVIATQANTNPINPTWTGQQPAPTNKPVSPWPIASNSSPAPMASTLPTTVAPINTPSIPKPPAPPPPPPPPPKPVPTVSAPAPVVEIPKPTIPPPPPNPVASAIPVPVKISADLPPPPNNPTSIPFDEPPKTIPEPGEEMIPPTPTMSAPTPAPTPASPVPPIPGSTPPPAVSGSVQDIDI